MIFKLIKTINSLGIAFLGLVFSAHLIAQSSGSETKPKAMLGDYVDLDESIRNDMFGTIDFPNTELKDVIKAIAKMSGKSFVLDRKIENKKVSILSQEKVTKQEAYNVFLSALYSNGLTVVSTGKFLKIIEVKDSLSSNTRIFVGDSAPNSEEVVTVLYQLQNLDAENIQRFLGDFLHRGSARVENVPGTNTLVLTDTGINLRRAIGILKSIDKPGQQPQLENIPIYHASAKEIAELIGEILDAMSGGTTRRSSRRSTTSKKTRGGGVITKIVPDERTNSLVVLANGRGITELKQLVKQLDTENAKGGGNIHVYYCKNSVAKELADTINGLISNSTNSNSRNTRESSRSSSGLSSRLSSRFNSSPRRSTSSGISFEGNIKVTADEATNSLVVIANGSDFNNLKKVLDKLDLPRRQVYIEATIMELKVGDDFEFGITTNVAGSNGLPTVGGFFPGASTGGVATSSLLTGAGLAGLVAGFNTGKAVSVKIGSVSQTIKTVTGMINFLDNTTQSQIIQQPQILTSDNKPGEIKVVDKKKSYVEKQTVSTSGTLNTQEPVTTPVKIKLKVTPRLSRTSDLVRLEIEQEIDSFSASNATGQFDTVERSTSTNVVVRDSDTVVVGGLQTERESDARNKIPLLGDLPILGWFFRGTGKKKEKVNLVMFLTPHIINEYSDLVKLTNTKINKRIEMGKELSQPKDLFADKVKKFQKDTKAGELTASSGWGPTINQDIDYSNQNNNTANSGVYIPTTTEPEPTYIEPIPEPLPQFEPEPVQEYVPPVNNIQSFPSPEYSAPSEMMPPTQQYNNPVDIPVDEEIVNEMNILNAEDEILPEGIPIDLPPVDEIFAR